MVAIHALDFARQHDTAACRVWATLGIHPHEAAKATAAEFEGIATQARDPLVVAIGEIGLDYYYDHSPKPVQLEVFERQLALAIEYDLPVSIHCRDAFDDCLTAIERHNPPRRGVFHCFTGDQAVAELVLALGWSLSFSGMITFPKLESLRQVAAGAPADRILIETDAPFLAPVPHRGQRNQPAFVAHTAAKLAELRGQSVEEIGQLTSNNFFRLFPRASV
jgi:TatD DNase family protein